MTNRFGRTCLAFALLFGASDCATPPSPTAPTSRPSATFSTPAYVSTGEETPRGVVELVVEAQRAYLERGDTQPFSELLLPDAEIQAGRARTSGPVDSVFGKQRLDAIHEWAAAHDVRSTTKFTTITVRGTPDGAELELQLECAVGTEEEAWFGQRFELVRHSGAWRIARFRYWPLDLSRRSTSLLPRAGKRPARCGFRTIAHGQYAI